MSRRKGNASLVKWKTPGSKGTSRRGKGRGTYSKKNKRAKAERYIQYSEIGQKGKGK